MDHLDFIRLLLEKGANPNAQVKDNTLTRTIFTMQWFFEDGATPFIRAAQSSDTALMKLLLEVQAPIRRSRPTIGDTALTAAGGIGWVRGRHLRALGQGERRGDAACCSISGSIRTAPTTRAARR